MADEVDLKKLAMDILGGRVFTNLHILEGDENLLPSIFMLLNFIDPDDEKNGGKAFAQKLQSGEIALIYEYMSKAGPLGVNGYPMFMSMRTLSKENYDILTEKIRKIQEVLDTID